MPTTSPKTAILVPPDGGARGVFGDKKLLKVSEPDTREIFRPSAKAGEEFRHVLGFSQPAAVEIIAPAKRDNAALASKPVKLELPERQDGDVQQKKILFLATEKIMLVFKTLRKGVISKKIERSAIAWHGFFPAGGL
jgi:hypothetical protein